VCRSYGDLNFGVSFFGTQCYSRCRFFFQLLGAPPNAAAKDTSVAYYTLYVYIVTKKTGPYLEVYNSCIWWDRMMRRMRMRMRMMMMPCATN